jgi:zinc transport system permease protein
VQSWESILFGAIVGAKARPTSLASIVATLVLAALWWHRRRLLFWAFDEESGPGLGMPAVPVRLLAMSVLAVAIVTAMKLMGVIPGHRDACALPGATALRVAARMSTRAARRRRWWR